MVRTPAQAAEYRAKKKRQREERRAAGQCHKCGEPANGLSRCGTCAEKDAAYQKSRRERAKQEVLDHYGRECSCCGESEVLFLTLDHINDDGADHRREHGGRTGGNWRIYDDVRKRGFPDDYRILCFNCNSGRARNGGVCPHEEVR